MAYDNKQYLPLGTKGAAYFTTHDAAVQYTGTVYVAIQFITASVFEVGVTGLVPETNYKYLSSNATSSLIAENSLSVDGVTWAAGTIIYGRWIGFELASGSCIAYVDE